MSGEYYTIITDALAARLASFAAGGALTHLTTFALGDGNGFPVSPSPAQVGLVRQVWPGVGRQSLDAVYVNPTNAQQIKIAFIVPANAGPFFIREIGIFDDDGVLLAIAKTNIEKKSVESGESEELLLTITIAVSSTAAVDITPGAQVYASIEYVDNKFNLIAEPFATIAEHLAGASETKKTHPKGVKAMIDAALEWFAEQLPSFATNAEHLSGLLNSRWCHPAGVKAMITEALGLSADQPLSWNAATRKMTIRAATNAVTGFGRVATDTEASSGVTNPLSEYLTPWVKPEQMAAAMATVRAPLKWCAAVDAVLFDGAICNQANNKLPYTRLPLIGGVGPVRYTVTAGALPQHLKLSRTSGLVLQNGVGAAGDIGTWTFTITATDSLGQSVARQFKITITAASAQYPFNGYDQSGATSLGTLAGHGFAFRVGDDLDGAALASRIWMDPEYYMTANGVAQPSSINTREQIIDLPMGGIGGSGLTVTGLPPGMSWQLVGGTTSAVWETFGGIPTTPGYYAVDVFCGGYGNHWKYFVLVEA